MSIEYPQDVIDRMELNARVIRYNEMRDAILYTMASKCDKIDDDLKRGANETTDLLLNMFGYSDHVLDNVLDTPERGLFWMMEEGGVLKRGPGMEVILIRGKTWRVRYWSLNKQNILQYAEKYRRLKERPVEESVEKMYSELSDEAWRRGAVPAETP
ncbi:MAG: DUF6015 family protein [Candidatus Aenigmatarchaeota archaeon]